jgi:hypothetical protein
MYKYIYIYIEITGGMSGTVRKIIATVTMGIQEVEMREEKMSAATVTMTIHGV